MNRMFTIFQCTIRKNIRDTGSLMQMFLLPVVLIFILGTALSPVFQHQEVSPTIVGYLNEDNGPVGRYFDEFIRSEGVRDVLAVAPMENRGEGLSRLQSGDILALIHMEQEFGSRGMAGEKALIEVTARPGNPLRESIVVNVLQSFIHGANATRALQQMGAVDTSYSYSGSMVEDRPVAASGIMPGAIDYYSVTMLVLFVMYGAMHSSFGMGESYLAPVGQRIRGTPIGAAEHYMGLVLGNVATVYVQALILIAFTRYVYGVSWGTNLPLILLVTFVLVLVAIGLGVMILMLTRSETLSSSILNVIIPFFAFIAGGYVKISFPGTVLPAMQHLSPNYLAQSAIFNTVYGGPGMQTMMMLGGLTLFAVGTFMVAMLAGRRAWS